MMARRELGQYIVADDEICHGKPTFAGTRIMVWQVLEMVAEGMDWIQITWECHGSVTKEAIVEAILVAGKALGEYTRLGVPAASPAA